METIITNGDKTTIYFPRKYGNTLECHAGPVLNYFRICYNSSKHRCQLGLCNQESGEPQYTHLFGSLKEIITFRRKLESVDRGQGATMHRPNGKIHIYPDFDCGPCYAIGKVPSTEQSIGLNPEDLEELINSLKYLERTVELEEAWKLKSNQF